MEKERMQQDMSAVYNDKHKSWKHKSSCQELNHNSQNLRLASFLYPYKILNLTISCDLYYVKLVVIQALKIF